MVWYWKIYRKSIETLSKLRRASIENLLNIYRKSIETYRKSIENLWKIYRTSIENHPPIFYRLILLQFFSNHAADIPQPNVADMGGRPHACGPQGS